MSNILISYRHFPVAIGRYFHWALQDLGHKVFSVGEYSDGHIPWGPNYYYPYHKFPPDLELPAVEQFPVNDVLRKVPFKPDVVIQCGDVSWLTGKPPCPNVIIATDPHCIDYTPRLTHADFFFCMQKHYLKNYPFGKWLPYAYDPYIHKVLPDEKRKIKFDMVSIGLKYEGREKICKAVEDKGFRAFCSLGFIYEDYCEIYNQTKIGLSYPSKEDLPARFWEGLAMKTLVFQKRVPDLQENFYGTFKEDVDYIGFDTVEEAIEKAGYWIFHDKERRKIAESGWRKVQPHTYQMRCKYIFQEIYNAKRIQTTT